MTTPADTRSLYPPIEPYRIGYLRVSDLHELYYEESGHSNGRPILFLHGGPGSGTSPSQRRYFDPRHYRIILFDQRGAGKSRPHACLEHNTTWDLVRDIEKLRVHLGIDRWIVFGGSWGSTLALAYGESYPERVLGFILRGIFLLRKAEIAWFYQEGASRIFPDAWEDFASVIPDAEKLDFVTAYYKRLTCDDAETRTTAAAAWTRWEKSTSFLVPRADFIEQAEDREYSAAFARIECHYFINAGFFSTESQLLEGARYLRQIPAIIIQGRYDLVCPMVTAWDLHRVWPEAEFRIVVDAGHSAFEPNIQHELIVAADNFRRL